MVEGLEPAQQRVALERRRDELALAAEPAVGLDAYRADEALDGGAHAPGDGHEQAARS